MKELSLKKEMSVVSLYLNGKSYKEIAGKAGVSTGSVANVAAKLKSGQFPEVQEPAEQIEMLRELAVDLYNLKLTPGQAIAGLGVLAKLQELGLEPGDIQTWSAMCKQLASGGLEAPQFVEAALYLHDLVHATGLTPDALEKKVQSLQKEMEQLKASAAKLKPVEKELNALNKKRGLVAAELAALEKHKGPLQKHVHQLEQREANLAGRISEMEQRRDKADQRLAATRKDLKRLAKVGLSFDALTGLVEVIAGVAHKHAVAPSDLRNRLLQELQHLDAATTLESLVKSRENEIEGINQAIAEAKKQRLATETTVQKLAQEQATLQLSIAETREHVLKEIEALAETAANHQAKLTENLQSEMLKSLLEVQHLRDEALTLGGEMGRLDAVVAANQWLRSIVALHKGDGSIVPSDARLVLLNVLRSFRSWMQQTPSIAQQKHWLASLIDQTIEQVEQWTV